jgi:hypothetical protein
VTAENDVTLRAIGRDVFVEAVTAHEQVAAAADAVIAMRLAG